ncbi:hypothetical protein [Bacterioplanoides pacificum]|uniref:DUF2946 domain-containing protein n=1 Tax=Bacterioplanoides pacificum TaxID=1171596 RepID=A0ABV7VQK5_9GAMM
MPFRRRSSWLALLLCTLMVLVASGQSVHEQLAGHAFSEQCDYCLQALDPSALVPPLLIALPAVLLDLAPQVLLLVFVPRRLLLTGSPRAPPVVAAAQ